MPGAVLLRYATYEDQETLLEMQRLSEGVPQWGEPVWGSMLAETTRQRVILIAEEQGSACGFIVMHLVTGIAELESVGVLPGFRGRGIGRALCEGGIGWARVSKASAVELEVRASNAIAISLYRSFGFAEQGLRKSYYDRPVEDAILMARKL